MDKIKKEIQSQFPNKPYLQIKIIIATFIKLYKTSIYDFSFYDQILKKHTVKKEEKKLLKLIYKIHQIYDLELKSMGKIDFDDMLHMANFLTLKKEIKHSYKYIIIDEYQDTSYVKCNPQITPGIANVPAITENFLAIGHSSGTDTLCGILYALELFLFQKCNL